MSNTRIILVEDNPLDVMLIKEALKQSNIAVTALEHYANGEAAAKAIAALIDPPDLFLLDLNVPSVHGLELLRIVRALPQAAAVPVGIITSSDATEDRIKSEQRGANAYIVKPYGYHDFLTTVGAAIVELLKRKPLGHSGSGVRRLRLGRAPALPPTRRRKRSASARHGSRTPSRNPGKERR